MTSTALPPAEAAGKAAHTRAAAAAPIQPSSMRQGTSAGKPPSSGAPSTTAMAQARVDEEMVRRLMAFGFGKAECVAALEATNGHEEYAAALLFDSR